MTPTYKTALLKLVETEKIFSKEITRDLQTKKNDCAVEFLENYLEMQLKRLECAWMTSHSTKRFVGSASDHVGD